MQAGLLLTVGFTLVAAVPRNPQRIVGGNVTTIVQYPFTVSLLYTADDVVYSHSCGGSILNSRSVLTASHCIFGDLPKKWRIRIGSSFINSGGQIHETALLITHPLYDENTSKNDVGIIRALVNFDLSGVAKAGSFAGTNYQVRDNEEVWAVGWGLTEPDGYLSQQLRDVQIWTINQDVCRNNYAEDGRDVSDDMLCTGWLGVGGRDQCTGDSGGPLVHNNVVLGVCSWGHPQCGHPKYPGVNARVPSHITWIQLNS